MTTMWVLVLVIVSWTTVGRSYESERLTTYTTSQDCELARMKLQREIRHDLSTDGVHLYCVREEAR